jgi:hypothetical protein
MRAFVSALSVAKYGNAESECEDAYSVHPVTDPDQMINCGPILTAVADGASESLLSGHWARLLTASLVHSIAHDVRATSNTRFFAQAVKLAANEWEDWLLWYLNNRKDEGNPIRWYEEPGLERGAHAAALAAHFTESEDDFGAWHACALGDVCLFQVRNDSLLHSFPLTQSSDFGNSPSLIGTKNLDLALIKRRSSTISGFYEAGDQFFIGSDAFSNWFLSQTELGMRPWHNVRDITCGAASEFGPWVRAEQESGRMHNDDTTIVHIDMG